MNVENVDLGMEFTKLVSFFAINHRGYALE